MQFQIILLLFLILGNALLLTPAGSFLRVIGALVLLLLPGLSWSENLALGPSRLMRWTIGLGLSYTLMMIVALVLYYVTGPITVWPLLVSINLLTIGAIIVQLFVERPRNEPLARGLLIVLLLILLYGAIFRLAGLGYSEFQGGESNQLVAAAVALEGDSKVLLGQDRGPAQNLIPMVVWRLTGTIDVFSARFPFALAGVLVIVTKFLLGSRFFGQKAGLLAAALIAMNGFMLAFSRIVQYQEIVVWMSLLALLCGWEWHRQKQTRWAILAGGFVGAGMLAHYDAIVILPALMYLVLATSGSARSRARTLIVVGSSLLIVAGIYFIPFLFNPELTQTKDYLTGRIGQELLKNTLANYFHRAILYNSLYYELFVGLLLLGFFARALANLSQVKRWPLARYGLPIVAVLIVISLILRPNLVEIPGVDLAFLPFALIFLGAFFSPGVDLAQRVIIVWLAAAFIGYNFAIAAPGTHIYVVVPAWVLLAGLMAAILWDNLAAKPAHNYLIIAGCLFLTILFSGYLYIAFLRQDVEFKTEWPDSHPSLYWFPYADLPEPDASFGFVHKEGWKSLGGLYATGRVKGEYHTNGDYGVGDWYARYQVRGCFYQSKNFFALKGKVIDLNRFSNHTVIGEVVLPNGRGFNVLQTSPTSDLGPVVAADMERLFDQTAEPTAFAHPVTESGLAGVNLADYVELVGYEVVNTQAQPGEQIEIVLYWQLRQDVHVDLDVFVHFESDEENGGAIWGQSNGNPACGEYPTSKWAVGEVVNDLHIVTIDPDTPPGTYRISVGMYLPESNHRLPVFNENGQPVTDSIELTTLSIQ